MEYDNGRYRRGYLPQFPSSHGRDSFRGKGECCILTKTVDEVTCNPLKLWHAMGEPSSLSGEQKKLLKEGARPLVEAQRKELEDGMADVCITVRENGVVYFEVSPVKAGGDRGYCYKRVVGK